MEITTLEGVDTTRLVQTFNAAFADYFIPFHLSREQLHAKMLAERIDLSLSVGVFDQGTLTAFILHGFDTMDHKKVVYNGGTGVIPEKRGLGLTKKMYGFILPLLAKKGINTLLLEVITKNVPAITSYKQVGFRIKRELLCYTGKVEITSTNHRVEIKELTQYNWSLMKSFWDISPTWQHANHVLEALKNSTVSLGAYWEDQLVGYIIFNPVNKRILQLSVSREFRKKHIASTLISTITKDYGSSLSVINVDAHSKSVHDALRTMGFNNNLNQFEMELNLEHA